MSDTRRAALGLAAISLGFQAFAQQDALRMAARLDAEGKCEQAEPYYREALAAAPASTAVLNNAGNHYLVCGQADKAGDFFERVLKINPSHANANLQLARLAVGRKQGARALEYLARVKEEDPAASLVRAEALHWAGRRAAALAVLDQVEKRAGGDPRVQFEAGLSCARLGLYDRAERAFSAALAKVPGDFDVLFNLGRAAARAQHYDRAGRALEAALRLRPGDPDSLVELGLVHAGRGEYSRAVYVLAQAREREPKRPDILLALARAAEEAGYYGDSARAYDEYLQLRPGEETVRRDRARVYCLTGTRRDEGLRELARYSEKHPGDPAGHFAQAQFRWQTDPEQALALLSTAARLDPGFASARFARAWLLHRLGRTAESLPDLEAARRADPKNPRVLDQMGVAYLALERPAEAEKVLRQALEASPDDAEVLMHLGRALMDLDRRAEAQTYLRKFQEARKSKPRDPRREPGMIELATAPAGERARQQIERLRGEIRSHPGDFELQLHLATLLLAGGMREEGAAEFRALLGRNPESGIREEAGRVLVREEQYELAREFLRPAAAERPAARLDLAMALFFTEGPRPALEVIRSAPRGDGDADVLMMEARILDAAGQRDEAEKVLAEALRRAAPRPQIAQQAALLLLRLGRKTDALDFLNRAVRRHQQDPDLLLTLAIAQHLSDRNAEAERTFRGIEARWPEWDRSYLAHGLALEKAGRLVEARQQLETALALGSRDALARCALARIAGAGEAGPGCDCAGRIEEVLFPGCGPS